jgi:hypothetical protein
MPLDTRKITHIAANRDKIRLARSETVVLVSTSGSSIVYTAIPNVTFFETGAVPAGISTRAGDITRAAHDAVAEFPISTVFPSNLKLIARTPTPTQPAVQAAARFTVLDKRQLGLGLPPNRHLLRLRRLR